MGIEAAVLKSIKARREQQRLLRVLAKALQPISALVDARGYSVICTDSMIIVDLRLASFFDAASILEEFQDLLRIEFDVSEDFADMGWRAFLSSALPGFRVDVSLTGEAPNCQRVIVSYEQRPVYEFHCTEQEEERQT